MRGFRVTIITVEKQSVLHIQSVFVSLVIHHAKRMRRVILRSVACPPPPNFSTSSQNGTTLLVRITYLLTPWCRVFLEKLTGLQLLQKFPAFHGTRRFITVLISVRHLSLSWASPIQYIYPHPASWRSILILSTHLRLGLPSGSFPPVSPPRPYPPPPLSSPINGSLSPRHDTSSGCG